MPRISPRMFCSQSFYKNFPKPYIEKEKGIAPKKVFGNRFGAPDLVEYDLHPDDYVPDEKLPWEIDAKLQRAMDKHKVKRYHYNERMSTHHVPELNTDPPEKWTMFVGDRVQVLVGKDKGKQGNITEIVRERDWCYVRGLNLKYNNIAPRGFAAQVLATAQKLNMKTEVALVDPGDEQATTVDWRWTESGDRVRVSERTGRTVPIPLKAEETFEYKTPESYLETPVDTPANLVRKKTFVPNLGTFEQDIMQNYDIKEERTLAKTYWR